MRKNRRYDEDEQPARNGSRNDRYGKAVPDPKKVDMVAKSDGTDDGVTLVDWGTPDEGDGIPHGAKIDYRGLVPSIDPPESGGGARLSSDAFGKHRTGRRSNVSKDDGGVSGDLPDMSHNIDNQRGGDSSLLEDDDPIYDDYIDFLEEFADAAKTEEAEAVFRIGHAYLKNGGSITDKVTDIVGWAAVNPDALEDEAA